MTPQELKAIRRSLGLSTQGLADVIGVKSGRTIRRWEAGTNDIPGPAEQLLGILVKKKKEKEKT